jgi:hypothetical protein
MPVLAMFPGPSKPPSVRVILQCLVDDLAPLATTGFAARLADNSEVNVRVRIAFVMGDSPGALALQYPRER